MNRNSLVYCGLFLTCHIIFLLFHFYNITIGYVCYISLICEIVIRITILTLCILLSFQIFQRESGEKNHPSDRVWHMTFIGVGFGQNLKYNIIHKHQSSLYIQCIYIHTKTQYECSSSSTQAYINDGQVWKSIYILQRAAI